MRVGSSINPKTGIKTKAFYSDPLVNSMSAWRFLAAVIKYHTEDNPNLLVNFRRGRVILQVEGQDIAVSYPYVLWKIFIVRARDFIGQVDRSQAAGGSDVELFESGGTSEAFVLAVGDGEAGQTATIKIIIEYRGSGSGGQ